MKKKLVKYFVCMISAAILLTMAVMTVLTYGLFEQRVFEDLRIEARLIAHMIKASGGIEEDCVDGELRLTLIDDSGVVLCDTQAESDSMENHSHRPEIEAALKTGEGTDVRESTTVQVSTYYYAVRLEDGTILRVAEETSSIWNIYLNAVPVTLAVIVLMMGLCLIGAGVVTQRLVRPIEKMTAMLGDSKGVTLYPELEPFMNKIKAQHEEILRSADMRVQFTANVSHELKTPLTSISGYAELIENGMAEREQARRFAGEIQKSAQRLMTLINDIIRLSQMDSPMTNLNLESVDAGQVAADTIEQMRINASKMNVTLDVDCRTAVMEADRSMLEELIYNLCDNAIRYNVHGGSVHVEVRPIRDQVMICVQDTGIGISKENQERVFERFYRVDKSRSKATGGTGLGLAIVKHIAAKHGASIRLESELGRGTAITVLFDKKMKTHEGDKEC